MCGDGPDCLQRIESSRDRTGRGEKDGRSCGGISCTSPSPTTRAVSSLWRMARREMLDVQETATSVVSGETLSPTALRKGWHAHVFYRTSGIERSVTGVITRIDANHIEIKSGNKPGVRQKIRAGDIERILSFSKRGELDRWRKARAAMRELQGPRVRLKAPSISPHWMIGRFAGAVRDSLEVPVRTRVPNGSPVPWSKNWKSARVVIETRSRVWP